ncbi:hypothetical protein HDV02_002473, partial [Globomyces sp. JEL0801]
MNVNAKQIERKVTYLSHHQSRKPIQGDQSIKDSLYSNDQLEYIKNLAKDHVPDDLRIAIHQERKALKDISQKKIKSWGNTVMGSRLKRLAMADEKSRLAEIERQNTDQEWAKIRAKEREEAIQRARLLQQCEGPRVRSLHSQLIMSNVLHERDKQIDYKNKYNLAVKIHEKEEFLKRRLLNLKELEKEEQQILDSRQKRSEFANHLRECMDKKSIEKATQRQIDKDGYLSLANEIKTEFQLKSVRDFQNKMKWQKEINQVLVDQIQQKNQNKEKAKREARELEISNERFNSMKHMFVEKRKDFFQNQQKEIHDRFRVVSEHNIKANELVKQDRDKYLNSISHQGPTKAQLLREEKILTEKEFYLKEQAEFEIQHKSKRTLMNVQAKELKLNERARNIENTESWKKETIELQEKKKKSLLDIKEFHVKQMEHKKVLKQEQKSNEMKQNQLKAQKELQELNDFDLYANQMIDDWKSQRKNVAPVMRSLEKDRPGYVKRRPGIMKKEYGS